MREPTGDIGRISCRLLPHPAIPVLCAICLAVLAAVAPRGAAAQAPSAPAASAPAPAPAPETAAAPPEAPAAPPPPATVPPDAAAPQDTGSEAAAGGGTSTPPPPPDAQTPPPPSAGNPPPPATPNPPPQDSGEHRPPEPHDGVSAGMTAAKLLIVDVREVFRSPEHWHGGEWALFGAEVAAVVTVGAFDESLQRDALRNHSSSEDKLAKDFRTFGNYGSFEVLGGFYLAGLIAHDKKAQETCLDGLFASGIAGGLVSPFLKVVVGRNRPNANQGAYSFHPFGIHQVSFPSGEATQAFAVASVISTQYPNPVVEFISYAAATLTAWGRVRANGHWASDSLAGALIGFHIGRTVVHINQRLRARVSAAPFVAPGGARGMMLAASF
jgi:hypothetical protein